MGYRLTPLKTTKWTATKQFDKGPKRKDVLSLFFPLKILEKRTKHIMNGPWMGLN